MEKILTYSKFIRLHQALAEYGLKCSINELNDKVYRTQLIYEHYYSKYGVFTAESFKGKRLKCRKKTKDITTFMESGISPFRRFMNDMNIQSKLYINKVLSYGTYLKLIEYLDEYCKNYNITCLNDKIKRLNSIYNYFIETFGWFIAENFIGEEIFFGGHVQDEKKYFPLFMAIKPGCTFERMMYNMYMTEEEFKEFKQSELYRNTLNENKDKLKFQYTIIKPLFMSSKEKYKTYYTIL